MGIADRVRQRQARTSLALMEDGSPKDSTAASSLAVVEDNLTIDRLKGTIAMMRRAIEASNDGSGFARMAFIMTAFTDELAEEFRDMDEMSLRVYLFQVGAMIAWIGHGDASQLPDSIRHFAELIQPTAGKDERSTHSELDTSAR